MRVFKETQRFTQTWLIALMSISSFVPLVIILQEYLKKDSTMTVGSLVFVVILIGLASSIIFFFKLNTKIDEHGVSYQFFPFHRKMRLIHWNEIKSISIRKYNPISEYGGWGLKANFKHKHSKAVNVSGDMGIQLIFENNKKLLIGTQLPNQAKQTILHYTQNKQTNE